MPLLYDRDQQIIITSFRRELRMLYKQYHNALPMNNVRCQYLTKKLDTLHREMSHLLNQDLYICQETQLATYCRILTLFKSQRLTLKDSVIAANSNDKNHSVMVQYSSRQLAR